MGLVSQGVAKITFTRKEGEVDVDALQIISTPSRGIQDVCSSM